MSGVFGTIRSNASYFFIVVGLVWAAIGVLTGSALVAWPAVACVAGGLLLRLRPGQRLAWSWAIATAALGLIVSVYQVWAWAPLLGGTFSTLADEALAGFAIFAFVHLLMLYAGASAQVPVRSETS